MTPALHFVSVNYPGVTRWLESGAAEGLWGFTPLEAGRQVEVPKAEAYGVGAWHAAYEDVHAAVRRMGASFGVAWSSSPQETDTLRAFPEFGVLLGLGGNQVHPRGVKVDWWACLHPALARVLPNAVQLPAPVHLEDVPSRPKEPWLGFFVPAVEKKAVFAQLLAVREFQRDHGEVRLQTNLLEYASIMDWLGLRYDLHPWLPRPEYLELLGRCRVVMHASLAESFGYGAVDALMAGARVVGSPAMWWLPDRWCAGNANDPLSVQIVLEKVWADALAGPESHPRQFIQTVARRQNRVAEMAVEAILAKNHK